MGTQMNFLDKIEKNHGRSLMALSIRGENSTEYFLFPFNPTLARSFGSIIGAGISRTAFCLDLTNPELAKKYSSMKPEGYEDDGFDWTGEGVYADKQRSELFELARRGVSLHMGVQVSESRDSSAVRELVADLRDFARISRPAGIKRVEGRPQERAEPGLAFEPLEWLSATAEALSIGAVAPKPAELCPAVKRDRRI